MATFFSTPLGNSGNTPAADRAAPQSAVSAAVAGRSPDEVKTLIRLLQARGSLSGLRRRRGMFSEFEGSEERRPVSIGLGIEE